MNNAPQMVCLGEALIDVIEPHTLHGAGANRVLPGGSPLNVAVAAARLGIPTALIARISNDPFGEHLHQYLARNGVDVRLVQRGPEPTSLAIASLQTDGAARYRFYREGSADTRLQLRSTALPPSVRLGQLSLSLLQGATRASSRRLLASSGRAKQGGQVVWLIDPNARPALWPDAQAFATEVAAWLAYADVLKVSAEDLQHLGWRESDAASRAWAAGVAAVVVTAGAQGARVYRPELPPLEVPAERVLVVDTVGAGDSFSAALAFAFLRFGLPHAMTDEDWRRALQLANAAAAITCSRAGANPPSLASVAQSFPAALP